MEFSVRRGGAIAAASAAGKRSGEGGAIFRFAAVVVGWKEPVRETSAASSPCRRRMRLPHGPTNLEPVLEAIAHDADSALPKELVLLTDADVDIKAAGGHWPSD